MNSLFMCFDDLLGFDFEAFFEKLDKQFIIHEEIDMDKLGRWLLGRQKMKKLSKRLSGRADLAAQTLCNAHDINTYADLVSYFMNKKAEIKKALKDRNILIPPANQRSNCQILNILILIYCHKKKFKYEGNRK